MNKTNTDKLLNSFPRLYRGYHKSPRESCMAFGFEVDDGWYNLIYKLSMDIEAVAHKEGLQAETEDWPAVNQVKEKYGTLCFYVHTRIDAIWNLTFKAEELSATVCESCGLPGKLRQGGWLRTLCDTCEEMRSRSQK